MKRYFMIYNPHCSKCRDTLALMQQRGIEPELIHYLDEPQSAAFWLSLQQQLGLNSLRPMLRSNEAAYTELNLAEADENRLLRALVASPQLAQRPIVSNEKSAVIARPPEKVLAFLDEHAGD